MILRLTEWTVGGGGGGRREEGEERRRGEGERDVAVETLRPTEHH